MADWVHCNKCFAQPSSSSKLKFHLTNCGHIYCEKCLNNGKQTECCMCKIPCNTTPLTANLNPTVECYFSDPNELFQKYTQVRDFQRNHRDRLYLYISTEFKRASKELQIVQNKYLQAKEHIKKLNRNQAALEKDNQRLRTFLKGSITPGGPQPKSGHVGGPSTPMYAPPPYTPAPSSVNSPIIRGGPSSNASWAQMNHTQKYNSEQKKYPTDAVRPQISANRLSLPRSSHYRAVQAFSTPNQDSSFNNTMESPAASNITMSSGKRFLSSSFNMSGLTLRSKASLPGRK